MILQNLLREAENPVRRSAYTNADVVTCFGRKAENNLNRLVSAASMSAGAAIPDGYNPNYSWAPARSTQNISAYKGTSGSATATSDIAGGLNADGSASGVATVSGEGGLVVPMAGTSSGVATTSGDIVGVLTAAGTSDGVATTSGTLGALAGLEGTASGVATVTGSMRATADMSGSAYVNQSEASVTQIVSGVWDAQTTDYNDAGTMGAAVSSAGTAGDPWIAELPGTYTDQQAGSIIGRELLRLAQFLALR